MSRSSFVYAKNSRQQLILSNIQQDGFTIYYYHFYTNTNKQENTIRSMKMNNAHPPLIERGDQQLTPLSQPPLTLAWILTLAPLAYLADSPAPRLLK